MGRFRGHPGHVARSGRAVLTLSASSSLRVAPNRAGSGPRQAREFTGTKLCISVECFQLQVTENPASRGLPNTGTGLPGA